MMKRKIILLMLISAMLVLTSCSGEKEFKFDGSISWNSTYTEIIAKYGTPEKEDSYVPDASYNTDKEFYMTGYSNFTYGDQGNFNIFFVFEKKTGKLSMVGLLKEYTDFFPMQEGYKSIIKKLTTDYGKPDKEKPEYFVSLWKTIKNTSIVTTNLMGSTSDSQSILVSIMNNEYFAEGVKEIESLIK